MAEQNNNNIFRYTGLSYEDLKTKVDSIISGDDRLKNFADSALYKIIVNSFIGSADLVNYYIERTSEEMFLDTAKHQSSVILNASQIGYVVTRPIPAEANFRFVLKGPLPGSVVAGQQLSIPAYQVVKFGGTEFITKYSYVYTLTTDDVNNLSVAGSTKVFTEADIVSTTTSAAYPLELVQGTLITTEIEPETQAGKKFQKYTVEDPTFSNLYGTEDLGDGEISTTDVTVNARNLTRVILKQDGESDIEFHVNRRSLTSDPYVIADIRKQTQNEDNANVTPVNACLIKTNYDTTVKLYFGDGISTALGPAGSQTVSLQYLSTQGSQANAVGVKGQALSYEGTISIGGNALPVANYSLFLESNITGGADLEDTESIRINAPSVFQSLDRLVTRTDYKYYLSTLTSPIVVKHSVVWGEAEEARARKVGAYQNLFNVAVVCAFGSLYKTVNSLIQPRQVLLTTSAHYDADDLDEILIGTADATANDESTYCQLFVQGKIVDLMTYQYDASNTENSELAAFLTDIKEKAQATVKNIYIPPIFQGFNLTGNIYIKPFVDAISTESSIKQTIRKYLRDNNNLDTPVYTSDIVNLIKSNKNVSYCDIKFEPIAIDSSAGPTYTDMKAILSSAFPVTGTDLIDVTTSAYDLFQDYLDSKTTDISATNQISVTFGYSPSTSSTSSLYSSNTVRVGDITERSFYDEYATNFFNACKSNTVTTTAGADFATSDYFTEFIKAGTRTLKSAIRNGMLDENGNIVNYSLPNEIAVIYDDNLNVVYSTT